MLMVKLIYGHQQHTYILYASVLKIADFRALRARVDQSLIKSRCFKMVENFRQISLHDVVTEENNHNKRFSTIQHKAEYK